MTKRLINAGRSQRGWSRVGQYLTCPQKFAYDQRLGLALIPSDPLTRGSMGHITQAHQHAIWGCQQGGCWVGDEWYTDPDTFLAPEDAMREWCDRNQDGHEHIDRMAETFRRYLTQHPEPPGRILAVEYPITAVLGWLGESGKDWGLWVIDSAEAPKLDAPEHVASLRGIHGTTVLPTPLNCPGHQDHGRPVYMTRRIDLVVGDGAKRAWVWDHKNQAFVKTGSSTDAYSVDGGFAAFRVMGQQIWDGNEGRHHFGGLRLNLIQTQAPWRVARPHVPPTPHRDGHYAALLWRAEHEIARLDVEGLNPWQYPKMMNESQCMGRYGACAGLDLCRYGEAAVTDDMLRDADVTVVI